MKIINKRIIAIISICVAISLILCSCGSKTAISKEDFIAKAESFGCITDDAGVEAEGVVSSTIAGKVKDDTALWTVEFYVLDDENIAKGNFETNKSKFDDGSGTTTSVDMENYSTYQKTYDGKYNYLCRVDATLIYVDIDEQYKDEVKEFIKELGY